MKYLRSFFLKQKTGETVVIVGLTRNRFKATYYLI